MIIIHADGCAIIANCDVSYSLYSYFSVDLDQGFKRYSHTFRSIPSNLNLNQARTC